MALGESRRSSSGKIPEKATVRAEKGFNRKEHKEHKEAV